MWPGERRRSNVTPKPLTKNISKWTYVTSKFCDHRFSPPEFLKVFNDTEATLGSRVIFDCLLLGRPRPKVIWLFNDQPMDFDDVDILDTSDSCRLTIRQFGFQHAGVYSVIAENEVGRATCTASLKARF